MPRHMLSSMVARCRGIDQPCTCCAGAVKAGAPQAEQVPAADAATVAGLRGAEQSAVNTAVEAPPAAGPGSDSQPTPSMPRGRAVRQRRGEPLVKKAEPVCHAFASISVCIVLSGSWSAVGVLSLYIYILSVVRTWQIATPCCSRLACTYICRGVHGMTTRPCTVQPPPRARRSAAKHAPPSAAGRPEASSTDMTREDGVKMAASGQALRSGRHRSLPAAAAAAARQRSPSASAAVPEARENAAEHDALRDDGMQAEQERPSQPPAGQRPRRPAVRVAGAKRPRRAASAGDDEEEPADAPKAAAEGGAGRDDDRDADAEAKQASKRRPARLSRPRRHETPVPATHKHDAEDKAVGSQSGGDGEEAAESEPIGTSVLDDENAWRRRRPRLAARKSYAFSSPIETSPSDGDDGADDAEEPDDEEDDSHDQAPRTAPDAAGPELLSGRDGHRPEHEHHFADSSRAGLWIGTVKLAATHSVKDCLGVLLEHSEL